MCLSLFVLILGHPDLLVNELSSLLTRERVKGLAWEFRIPTEMHFLVPCEEDCPLAPPIRYCVVYAVQLGVGLCFALFSILVNLL